MDKLVKFMVMPKEEFKGLVMEAVAEMYNHMPDFLAEDIAHDMQYRVARCV